MASTVATTMAATRGTETATVASATTGPCTTTITTTTGPTGPTGPGPTSVASSAASSAAAATGRSTSPEWETSPRRPPPRPRAESILVSDDQTPFSVIHGLIAQVCTL